ncbi:hypothetical protein MYX07_06800 [Patescibacteria group bacterium AH-259-L07]|nr:hypothetical protein [Patescibacteria group bacterium AH-259-L07]
MLEKKDFQKIGKIVEESDKRTDKKINSLAVAVKHGFDDVDKRLDGMGKDIGTIKKTMVTKIHFNERLDEKMADLRGDIVVLLRKEDRKLEALIEKLKQKHIITDDDVKELHEIQIFAQ